MIEGVRLEWHFCHKLQLRKWLYDVKPLYVLVTNISLKCEKLKENIILMWGVKENLEPLRFRLLWHGFLIIMVCLSVILYIKEYIAYQITCFLELRNSQHNKTAGKVSCSMYIIHYKAKWKIKKLRSGKWLMGAIKLRKYQTSVITMICVVAV